MRECGLTVKVCHTRPQAIKLMTGRQAGLWSLFAMYAPLTHPTP